MLALVDTGAQIDTMSYAAFRKIGLRPKPRPYFYELILGNDKVPDKRRVTQEILELSFTY